MALKEYKKKRKFSETPEPRGKIKKSENNIFVVQKHDASHLHYDFRLEIAGVLKSWAVPKGPSLNPEDKRLAIKTEDHPVDYSDFEGVIPEGHYGAGIVMLWDKGSFENITEKDGKKVSAIKGYKNGHLSFELKGKKLKGGWSLHRFRGDKWLLVKQNDDESDERMNILNKKKSVKSGKTLKQIGKDSKK